VDGDGQLNLTEFSNFFNVTCTDDAGDSGGANDGGDSGSEKTKPYQPDPPTTTISGSNVEISWIAP